MASGYPLLMPCASVSHFSLGRQVANGGGAVFSQIIPQPDKTQKDGKQKSCLLIIRATILTE